jgi:hypothetical protein
VGVVISNLLGTLTTDRQDADDPRESLRGENHLSNLIAGYEVKEAQPGEYFRNYQSIVC